MEMSRATTTYLSAPVGTIPCGADACHLVMGPAGLKRARNAFEKSAPRRNGLGKLYSSNAGGDAKRIIVNASVVYSL